MALPRDGSLTPPVPSEKPGASSHPICPNCASQLHGAYCSVCGEKNFSREDLSFSFMIRDLVEHFALLDNRFVRTLGALLTRPGLLTKRYINGGRSRYTKPLTLFVVLNIVFFFIQPHTGLFRYSYEQYTRDAGRRSIVAQKLAVTGEPADRYATRFNIRLQEQKKSLLIVSVPLFALVMLLLYARSGITFTEHLVFASHVYAFYLFLMAFAIGLAYRMLLMTMFRVPQLHPVVKALDGEAPLVAIILGAMTAYISLGLRRAYDDGMLSSLARGLVLGLTIPVLTYVYHHALFFATLWAT